MGRERSRIVANLEALYREAFERAKEAGNEEAMARLDFEFQQEQLRMEVLLDIRDLLAEGNGSRDEPGTATSLLEKAEALKRITRLR